MKYILMGLGLYFLYKTFFQNNDREASRNHQNFNGPNADNRGNSTRDGEYVDYEDLTNK